MTLNDLQIRTEFGQWVDQLGDEIGGWRWYFTGTFRDVERRGTWTQVGLQYANRAFVRWLDEVVKRAGGHDGPVEHCAAWEWQKDRGVPHVHALVSGTRFLYRKEFEQWWDKEFGFAKLLPYDRQRGAASYLAKYVTKDSDMIKLDLSKGLIPVGCKDHRHSFGREGIPGHQAQQGRQQSFLVAGW